jgi:hypothetical protein
MREFIQTGKAGTGRRGTCMQCMHGKGIKGVNEGWVEYEGGHKSEGPSSTSEGPWVYGKAN